VFFEPQLPGLSPPPIGPLPLGLYSLRHPRRPPRPGFSPQLSDHKRHPPDTSSPQGASSPWALRHRATSD